MDAVLVTGGCGYIGSHIVLLLVEKGYKTIIVDNNVNSSSTKIQVIRDILKKKNNKSYLNIEFFKGDIRDSFFLEEVFLDCKNKGNPIKSVIHLAGLKSVSESIQKKNYYLDVNYHGTLNLLNVMKKFYCNKFIFSSSATVYGNNGKSPIKEETVLSPINYYGLTKLKVETELKKLYYDNNAEYEIMVLRYFNPIGSYNSRNMGEDLKENPPNIFPRICNVANGFDKKLIIFGNDWPTRDGTCIRDYVHVMDIADGHVAALEYLKNHEKSLNFINLGTGVGTTVMELLNTFQEVNKIKINYEFAPRRDGDLSECYANVDLAKRILNWGAKKNIQNMCKDGWDSCKLIKKEF